ncbi:DUF4942 domain-containing protein (plasmid) [Rahnella aceris]
MSEVIYEHPVEGVFVEAKSDFFAPVSSDLVDTLLGSYQSMRKRIEMLSSMIHDGDNSTAIRYFLEGNRGTERFVQPVTETFKLSGAINNLNANYWQQALSLTDVYELMPAARREQWNVQIRNPGGVKSRRLNKFELEEGRIQKEWDSEPLPDFEEDNVRSTLVTLLNLREQFFGERVDGLFKNLSGEHVTNQPQGFSKRMIMYYSRKEDYISDLRIIVAKFMGRDTPTYYNTTQMLDVANRNIGKWTTIDGGSMRIRTYMKGTAHFEIHPEMAWRLNAVLASMYPMAIPPEFRQKPNKKVKDFVMMGRPLPFSVINIIASMKRVSTRSYRSDFNGSIIEPQTLNANSLQFSSGTDDEPTKEARKVLSNIGGVQFKTKGEWWEFDYDPREVIDQIITSGCIPDHKSHQFYPTSEKLAQIAVELAYIDHDDICLEPSAGMGGIADHLPKENTVCIEISELHCKVLQAKGFETICHDFLSYAEQTTVPKFNKCVMNPPFSDGRAKAHVIAAASQVVSGGRLVAIMPSGFKDKTFLQGWEMSWSHIYENEFEGTTISVVILTADRH